MLLSDIPLEFVALFCNVLQFCNGLQPKNERQRTSFKKSCQYYQFQQSNKTKQLQLFITERVNEANKRTSKSASLSNN
jgi:hypothetical protein